jgi:biotin carboxylase
VRRVLVIGGTPALVLAVRRVGVRCTYIHNGLTSDSPDSSDIVLDIRDHQALLAAARQEHSQDPFDAVLSLTEDGLLPAAMLVDSLGLPGNPFSAVDVLKNKSKMRALLSSVPRLHVRSAVVSSAGELGTFYEEHQKSVIIKPLDGTASEGIYQLTDADCATTIWANFTSGGQASALAEEFLDGPEYSVEAFSHAGTHVIVAVTAKEIDPASFVELAHSTPAHLDDQTSSALSDTICEFLTTVGIVEGPTHTEVKLTQSGPRIIESHNRIGGDKIRELVLLSTGVNLLDLTVQVPLGLAPAPRIPTAHTGAAIRFLTTEPGRIEHIHLPDCVPASVEIVLSVRVGDSTHGLRSSRDRVGYVLASGSSAESALADATQYAKLIRFDVSPHVSSHEGP